ncbi:IS200/IS605 family transposase ISPa18 [Pseudomonas fluorescens]|uniref:RNA-guided endonuclease InsQ/TnpB family protein n=1 Tax=Pseudomonas fluorescens TaxID=294 RepID=UPI001255EE2C|nr:RNA-guided endonuclease TnpB family protein [Pseudomonas fluorescens]CAG8867611.1 IS200/IS605 family transposase ISPa18 [Pseudomonas fluorescens]VVP91526.1 IS200/IS605 family transposase ISPa18 [Pseudomonas fluorescens]
MSKRAYKFRVYPTAEQKLLLEKTFGCVRFVYNHILDFRSKAYAEDKARIGFREANAALTLLKKDPEKAWLNDVSCVPLQQVLRHQQTAFTNFFEKRAGYPSYKKKHHRQSAEFTRSAFKYVGGQLFLAKSKVPLDVRWSRDLPSAPSTVTVSRDCAGRYFVSCLCEFEPEKLPVSPLMVGIDLGLTDLFTRCNGVKEPNPRHTAKYAAQLALLQRRLAKKKLGSANRLKAKRKVARLHAKISDTRQDNLHQVSRRLINENQVICVESLKVKNMIRNPKLAKAIADAGWGEFVRHLDYKGDWAGRQLVKIDQWYPSSKTCSGCGHVLQKLALSTRSWTCPVCGEKHDRDTNAAKNIRAVGLTVLACGERVRPTAQVA